MFLCFFFIIHSFLLYENDKSLKLSAVLLKHLVKMADNTEENWGTAFVLVSIILQTTEAEVNRKAFSITRSKNHLRCVHRLRNKTKEWIQNSQI